MSDRAGTGSGGATVMVVHEANARTARAARRVAAAVAAQGREVSVIPLDRASRDEAAAAEVLLFGFAVEGNGLLGVRPSRSARIWTSILPSFRGVTVGLFCTTSAAPGRAVDEVRSAFVSMGGRVPAVLALPTRGSDEGAEAFVARVLASAAERARTPGRSTLRMVVDARYADRLPTATV